MFRSHKNQGFSLIELLLVLAVLAIISAIAIPSFLGQRRRARMIGDATANARAFSIHMEQFRTDFGSYGPAAATATWTFGPGYDVPALVGFTTNPCPNFRPQGNSQMNYLIRVSTTLNVATGVIAGGGTTLNYTLSVSDSVDPTDTIILEMNDAGALWRHVGY